MAIKTGFTFLQLQKAENSGDFSVNYKCIYFIYVQRYIYSHPSYFSMT